MLLRQFRAISELRENKIKYPFRGYYYITLNRSYIIHTFQNYVNFGY